MAVDVVVGAVLVKALTDQVREPADSEEIFRGSDQETVFASQPLTGLNLGGKWIQATVSRHLSLLPVASGVKICHDPGHRGPLSRSSPTEYMRQHRRSIVGRQT